MIRQALLSALALAALASGCSPTTAVVAFGNGAAEATGSSNSDVASLPIGNRLRTELLEQELLQEVNDYRARHGVAPLADDPVAASAAAWMSRYQASISTMTHSSTVAGMTDFDDRYGKLGGERILSGAENIAWHQLRMKNGVVSESYRELAGRIVGGWIDSPPHRRNLLLASERGRGITGLGVARGTNSGADGVYSTMDVFFVEPSRGVTGT